MPMIVTPVVETTRLATCGQMMSKRHGTQRLNRLNIGVAQMATESNVIIADAEWC
ncbi:hypothetical protein EGR_10683 [Echinococcus granulosus]|uniref:Uncharacterized protein n=1 Tax=Echinococcus granulosus TaxID=6210 RepID=W6U1R5_ECHGR|nr:hypothetical protein EGR_10683 [Echinococcus granulosus]EUB54461.1 hypothetical protein EGR_10683 [Echinococcus granulosus]